MIWISPLVISERQAHKGNLTLTLPTPVPFRATPDIGGGNNLPPISYAGSICAILIKLSEFKQLDE